MKHDDLLDMNRAQLDAEWVAETRHIENVEAHMDTSPANQAIWRTARERLAAIDECIKQLDAWAAPVAAAMQDEDLATLRDKIQADIGSSLRSFRHQPNTKQSRDAMQAKIEEVLRGVPGATIKDVKVDGAGDTINVSIAVQPPQPTPFVEVQLSGVEGVDLAGIIDE